MKRAEKASKDLANICLKNWKKGSQISNNEISLPFYSCYLSYDYREVSPSAAVCRGDQKVTHDSPRQLRHSGSKGGGG